MANPPDGFDGPALWGPAYRHIAITPSDGTALPFIMQAIYVGVAGTVAITDMSGTTVTYTVPAGITIPIRATYVKATGTTSTGIIGLYS